MNINSKLLNCVRQVLVVTLVLILGVVGALPAFAQQSGNNANQQDNQDRDQVQERVQDPSTHDDDEPSQNQDRDRMQDQDRLQNLELNVTNEPSQDRDRIRDRVQDYIQSDPTQNRDRSRIHATSVEEFETVIRAGLEMTREMNQSATTSVRNTVQNQNTIRVGAMAMVASENLTGQYGRQIAQTAQELEQAYDQAANAENTINNRSWIRKMLFGGDSDAARIIQNQVQSNNQRMNQLREYINECDCDERIREMLREQLTSMEQEHGRINQIAEKEITRWGIFSWRF